MARLQSFVHRAFAAGELAPALAARADLASYTRGLRTCRNFLVHAGGGLGNRGGTQYLATAKHDGPTFLFPFLFPAADASYLVEAGDRYLRFHHRTGPVRVADVAAYAGATAYVPGDLVLEGGVHYYAIAATTGNAPPNATYWHALAGDVYEIPTPYVEGRFMNPAPLCWSQAGLVVTLTHLDEPPRELVYAGRTSWTLRLIETKPSIAPPTGLAASGEVAGAETRVYVVTAAAPETYEESLASSPLALADVALPTPEAPIVVAFTATPGAVEHHAYCDVLGNGVFGYIGTTVGATFSDPGLAPDFMATPPLERVLFAGLNEYPAVSVVHQQRRVFAGTHNDRGTVYASQVGKLSNFSIRSPLQDDDAVTWKLASNRLQPVMHLIGLQQLVVLTDTGEWLVLGADGVLTPTGITLDQHGYVGAAFVAPVVIGNTIMFVQARGTILRSLAFDERVRGLSGGDVTVLARHLFDGYTIVDLDYAQVPDSIVWCVRSDGVLLGLTWIPEDEVFGWHRHDTEGGLFEQVCVLPEGNSDAAYVVVNRSGTRTIERLATRASGCFLDSSVSRTGAAATAVSGLDHLEGVDVYAAADGVARGPYTVSGGAITLPVAASTVHVGRRITADLVTLDLDVQGTALRDTRKRVQSITVVVDASSQGFYAGRTEATLLAQRREAWQPAGVGDGNYEINLTAAFDDSARVLIRHTDPLPLSILGLVPRVEIGG